MKASDARKLTEEAKSLQGEVLRKVTLEVIASIEKAAKQGKESIEIDQSNATNPIVQDRLKALGYTVKFTSDQRDGDYLTVSW